MDYVYEYLFHLLFQISNQVRYRNNVVAVRLRHEVVLVVRFARRESSKMDGPLRCRLGTDDVARQTSRTARLPNLSHQHIDTVPYLQRQ
jgi:hypothetical protein